MALAIKRIHNLPPHLTTLPDITQKPKSYVVFLSIVSGSEKNRFWWVKCL